MFKMTLDFASATDLKAAGLAFTTSKKASTCYRCGGNGWFPTRSHGACFRCGGDGKDPRHEDTVFHFANETDLEAAKAADKDALAAERAKYEKYLVESAAAEAAVAAENKAFWLADPAVAALAAAQASGKTFGEVVANSLFQLLSGNFGNDKFGAYVARPLYFAAAQLDADAKAVAAGVACPVGKVTVTGKVVTTKEQSSQFGTTVKCLVVSPDGWKVWGTLPAGYEKGDMVRFNATVEGKDGDPLFGFYKRPTKVVKLAADGSPVVA